MKVESIRTFPLRYELSCTSAITSAAEKFLSGKNRSRCCAIEPALAVRLGSNFEACSGLAPRPVPRRFPERAAACTRVVDAHDARRVRHGVSCRAADLAFRQSAAAGRADPVRPVAGDRLPGEPLD